MRKYYACALVEGVTVLSKHRVKTVSAFTGTAVLKEWLYESLFGSEEEEGGPSINEVAVRRGSNKYQETRRTNKYTKQCWESRRAGQLEIVPVVL